MSRATASLVGLVLLLAVAVIGAAAVASAVPDAPTAGPPRASLSLAVDASADRLTLTHRAGEAIDVDEIDVTVHVAGEPLRHQPPVPFFASRGFESGPTGPFNSATAGSWTAGETAAFEVAATNAPGIAPGDRVTVTIRTVRGTIARLSTVATVE
mgnify:CR=1 FL=1